MTDLSVDIEAFGTSPGAAVVGIGACFFDASTGEIGEKFYRAINLATCINAGMHMEPGAVMWWLGQTEEARNAIRFNTVTVRDAFTDFRAFIEQECSVNDVRPWTRGPGFDGTLLAAAHRLLGMELPWRYWNERCHRTLTARNPSVAEPERAGTYHRGDDDAAHQALWLLKIAAAQRARKAA